MPERRYGLCLLCEPPEPAGVSTYARQLIEHMAPQLGADERLVVLRHQLFPKPLRHRRVLDRVVPFPARRSPVRRLAEQVLAPVLSPLLRLDTLHAVNHVVPLLCPAPMVVTLHDTRLFDNRSDSGLLRRWFRKRFYPASLARAQKLIAVSYHGARALARSFSIPEQTIAVSYHGPGQQPTPLPLPPAADLASGPMILHVGQHEPHKNVPRLIDAFALARPRLPEATRLVLAGSSGADSNTIRERIKRHDLASHVVTLGYVSDGHLATLYARATVLAYPSLDEGFGLPPLEAMRSGTAVVAAAIPVLREICGSAARFVDPLEAAELAESLHHVVTNQSYREGLVQQGLRHAATFSWERTAAATLAIYRELANRA